MLPLGLLLFAQDIPPLQKPMAQALGWIERKWLERQRAKERERASRNKPIKAFNRFSFSVVTALTPVTQKPALLAITWLHRGIL